MKILMANKFFYIKGGSETYQFSLKRLLEEHGHQVIDFSMKDPNNFDSPYSDYFVDHIDYTDRNLRTNIKNGLKIIYSLEAKKKLERLVEETKPDLAHLHLFQHQLSTSILDVLKKHGVPMVYTAHEFKMVCPNYKMLSHGRLCEACKGHHYFSCVKNRCVKDSAVKSLICFAEARVNQWRGQYDKIGRIITPSAFYRDKLIEFGVKPERVVHICNFLGKDREPPPCRGGSYYLYMGRLSEEKGVSTLIQAFKTLGLPLKIVGTGPDESLLKESCTGGDASAIEFYGFLSGRNLKVLLEHAKALVLPSEWYENGPYSAIEALQAAKPLIVSDLGGNPELVNQNGFVFSHGQPRSLSAAVASLEAMSQETYREFCANSRSLYEESYTAESHYEKIMEVYSGVLSHPRT